MNREPTHDPSVLERLVAALRAELGSGASIHGSGSRGSLQFHYDYQSGRVYGIVIVTATRSKSDRLEIRAFVHEVSR